VTVPQSIDEAWTSEEFTAVLETLAAASPTGVALDVREDYGIAGEWGTFAFTPLLQSAGGNLISDSLATGSLDSDSAVDALTTFASWKAFVDPNADGQAFPAGRTALGWGGHWMYPEYSAALGDQLVALPLPNFGDGAKTGAGSWTWGMGAGTSQGIAAGAFLDFLLNDENVTAMTAANGAPPATKTAFNANELYASGGPLALWGEQLAKSCPASAVTTECVAIYRPATAGYPIITSEFQKALSAIWNGSDVGESLTNAAKAIDQSFADNNNFN
jgi:multiple sugar transport system substrate-binding protein